jgi:hypothetical protein
MAAFFAGFDGEGSEVARDERLGLATSAGDHFQRFAPG